MTESVPNNSELGRPVQVEGRWPRGPELLSPSEAKHTVESLHCEYAGGSPWIYWILVGAIVCALASLPFIIIDDSIRISGIIRPRIERTQLLLPESGYVEKVFVRDNEQVQKRQPLLELNSKQVDDRIQKNRDLANQVNAIIGDIEVLIGVYRPVVSSLESEVPEVPSLRTASLIQESVVLISQLAETAIIASKAKIELERAESLGRKGILPERDVTNARFEYDRVVANRTSSVQQTLALWEARLSDEKRRALELSSEAILLDKQKERHSLLAPEAGTVMGFSGVVPGLFLSSSQSIGFVSPDQELVLEASVPSRFIAHAKIGQQVKIHVDSYPFTQWGHLTGTVESVSDDILPTANGASSEKSQPFFKILVTLKGVSLSRNNGETGKVTKGMAAATSLVRGKISLAQMLMGKANEWARSGRPTGQ